MTAVWLQEITGRLLPNKGEGWPEGDNRTNPGRRKSNRVEKYLLCRLVSADGSGRDCEPQSRDPETCRSWKNTFIEHLQPRWWQSSGRANAVSPPLITEGPKRGEKRQEIKEKWKNKP